MWNDTADRGQINFDFAVGVSVLVITIVVAMSFVPGLLAGPTVGRAQADQVAADRTAAWLAEDGLTTGPGNGADADCTAAFFDSDTANPDGCRDFSGDSVSDRVQVEDRFVNVSIRRGDRLVCWSTSAGEFGTADSPGGCTGMALSGGANPVGADDVAVARQPVDIDGYQATIVVRTW